MTSPVTRSLPDTWRGEYSLERSRRWMAERDTEALTLLVTDRRTGEAVGLDFLRPGGLLIQWDWERGADDEPYGLSRDEMMEAIGAVGLVHVHVDTGVEVVVGGQN